MEAMEALMEAAVEAMEAFEKATHFCGEANEHIQLGRLFKALVLFLTALGIVIR